MRVLTAGQMRGVDLRAIEELGIPGMVLMENASVGVADGLNVIAGEWQLIKSRTAGTVLTPHPGEAARWLGISAAEIQQDRMTAARELADRSGAVVVLKGFRSLVAAPDGAIWINPTGNSGMATGGSGDVLTGLITALLGKGYDAVAAACVGVYAHGLAGDLMAEKKGRSGLAASDLVDGLAEVWQRWEV